MENTDRRMKPNMFKYVGKNNTLYDMLGKYYPELNGNYSTASFLNNINSEYSDEKLYSQYNIYEIYDELLEKLLNSIKDFNDGNPSKISEIEKEELLEKLKEVDSDEYLDSFDTVEEYIEFIRSNIKDPSIKKMRDVAIIASFKYASYNKEESLKYRGLAVQLHVNAIRRIINEKYKDEPYNEEQKQSELEDFETMRAILGSPEHMERYDQYLMKNMQNKQKKVAPILETIKKLQNECVEIENNQDFLDRCQEYRKFFVESQIKRNLTEEQKIQLKQGDKIGGKKADVMSVILGDYRSYSIPDKDTFEWEFKEFKEPQVILNTVANYAEDEIENQRVIAVSYGFLNYRTGFTKEDIKNRPSRATNGSSYELELIGVTRKGIDGDSTYFTFTTFDNVKLMSQSEINLDRDTILMDYSFKRKTEDSLLGKVLTRTLQTQKGEQLDENQIRIYDKLTGEPQFLVKTNQRIPEDLEQFYANVFFSDIYLSAVEKAYSGYAGVVLDNGKNPSIIYELPLKIGEKSPEYISAIKYAKTFPIRYKSDPNFTLKKYIESDRLKNKQNEIVENTINNKKKSEEQLQVDEDSQFHEDDDGPSL